MGDFEHLVDGGGATWPAPPEESPTPLEREVVTLDDVQEARKIIRELQGRGIHEYDSWYDHLETARVAPSGLLTSLKSAAAATNGVRRRL